MRARRRAWFAGPLSVAVLVTGVYGFFVIWHIGVLGGDPSALIVAGPPASDPASTWPNVHVFPQGVTYDGQFFYRLALEPSTSVQTAYGVSLDEPAYRQQRILYPLLAWVISIGMWQLAPVALIVVNLVAVGLLAFAAATFATGLGRGALSSVMVPFYPGYLVTISRDLAELTEAALLVTALVLLQRRRYWLASAALIGGTLAKETMLVVPTAGVALWLVNRARRPSRPGPPLRVWLAPIGAYVVWFGVMLIRWGAVGIGQGGSNNFGLPFDGLAEHLQTLRFGSGVWRDNVAELGLVFGAALAVVLVYRSRVFSSISVLPLACVLWALAATLYSSFIWHDDYAFLRALHELFLTASLALVAATVWVARGLGLATGLVWLLFVYERGAAL